MAALMKESRSTAIPLRDRARKLSQREIPYIYAREFETLSESALRASRPDRLVEGGEAPPGNSSDLRNPGLASPLLTPQGETHLFRLMNFLKHRANSLRAALNPSRPRKSLMETIDRLLDEAEQARALIIQSNLRLVVALAKKYSSSRTEFEEFVSEGNLILVNAVDKYDFSRGFRFSTYATHSIQRHFFRLLQRRQRRRVREVSAASETLAEMTPQPESEPPLDQRIADQLIRHFDECLDPRERMIIEARFGIGRDGTGGTLKSVAASAGLSKERVRQLQARAINKLQDLAVRLNLRPEAAM